MADEGKTPEKTVQEPSQTDNAVNKEDEKTKVSDSMNGNKDGEEEKETELASADKKDIIENKSEQTIDEKLKESTNEKMEETNDEKIEETNDEKIEETNDEKTEETNDEKMEETNDETKTENLNIDTKSQDKKEDKTETKTDGSEKKPDEKNGEDEGKSESEEELPPGLLERPVEILKDKRERKKTTRFTYDDVPTPSPDKKKLEIPTGRGIKLSMHPRVALQLERNKSEDLKIIHKLFFGTFGDTYMCKKNIRNFSGFTFEKDSTEYEKKEDYVGRFTMDNLKWTLTVCDVENKKGKKDDLIDSLLEWCLHPTPSGKDLPTKRKKKEKTQRKKKVKTSKSPGQNNSSITSDDTDSDVESDEDTSPRKSPKKPGKSQTPKSSEKKPRKRKSTAETKKIAKVKIGSPLKKSDESDSDDSDVPLKKRKSPPTNGQIRKSVEKILKGADLEVITMKAVCVKVYSQFPNFDLSDRKSFIKETVKKIIS